LLLGLATQYVAAPFALLGFSAMVLADDVHPVAVSGVDLRWTLSLATSATRRPSAALRALLAMVDQHVRTSP
ncbi:MAG TPA: hypothetical protein VNO31_47515, partial [Umezawaea sp.]|nr:hypothetical protein [Umezawaea sp.]